MAGGYAPPRGIARTRPAGRLERPAPRRTRGGAVSGHSTNTVGPGRPHGPAAPIAARAEYPRAVGRARTRVPPATAAHAWGRARALSRAARRLPRAALSRHARFAPKHVLRACF